MCCSVAGQILSPDGLDVEMKIGMGRRLGGSESARTEQPNREVVSSRPCVRARSVIHVESGIKCGFGPLPFSLLVLGVLAFPFSLQDLSAGACLSKSEQI